MKSESVTMPPRTVLIVLGVLDKLVLVTLHYIAAALPDSPAFAVCGEACDGFAFNFYSVQGLLLDFATVFNETLCTLSCRIVLKWSPGENADRIGDFLRRGRCLSEQQGKIRGQ